MTNTLLVREASLDGSSIGLITGWPMNDDGKRMYPDDDTIVTTIGGDHRMVAMIIEALDYEPEVVVNYEAWQVLA